MGMVLALTRRRPGMGSGMRRTRMTGSHVSRKQRQRIVLTTGGTGGHMFPAQALARTLIDSRLMHVVTLITDQRGSRLRRRTCPQVETASHLGRRGGDRRRPHQEVHQRRPVQRRSRLSCRHAACPAPRCRAGRGGRLRRLCQRFRQPWPAPISAAASCCTSRTRCMGRANRLLAPQAPRSSPPPSTTVTRHERRGPETQA